MTKARRFAAALVLITPILLGAKDCDYQEENRVIDLVNQSRAQHGLPPVQSNLTLINDADAWADVLAAFRNLAHSNGQGYTWERIGGAENVGVGPSIEAVHDAYMNSPPHRANILNPSLRFLGGGHAVGGDGRTYTVHQYTFNSP